MRMLILSTFLYACESWTLRAEIERRIQALEMRCYISYKDHVMNEEVHNRIQNVTGVHDDLLTMVRKRKLRWNGHISRSSGMVKTILHGTVKGARRRGRQKKRWEEMDGNGVWKFPEGSRRQGRMERYCCNIICGASMTSKVKGLRWDENVEEHSVLQIPALVTAFFSNKRRWQNRCTREIHANQFCVNFTEL